jgi:hypothetical protein
MSNSGASLVESWERWKREPKAPQEKRYTAPLQEVLKRFNVPKQIGYLSLDVEGAEYLIMQNFPWEEYTVSVLTIERPAALLRDLLGKHGYLKLKDLAWWGEYLWAHESTGLTPDHPMVARIITEERS